MPLSTTGEVALLIVQVSSIMYEYNQTHVNGVVVGGSPWIVLGCSGYPRHPGMLRHKGWWLVGVPGLSLDVPGILGIRGCSDTRGGGWWESLDCPGCSGYPRHPAMLRHKGWWLVGVPGLSLDVPGILGIREYLDTRGGGW